MKPQCNSSADCLRELARVMEHFGIKSAISAVSSIYVNYGNTKAGDFGHTGLPEFTAYNHWAFAIAEVEGKPVFPGDTLYYPDGNSWKPVSTIQAFHSSSWNPPKPKTVMVEMLVEDVKDWSRMNKTKVTEAYSNLVDACQKALEQMK